MRLWLATTELHPFSGGIGVYAHHAGRMLAAGGVETTVIHHDPAVREAGAAWRDGYRLIRFGARTLCGQALETPLLQGHLAASFATCAFLKQMIHDEGAPDVVEFQDYGALGYAFLKHRLMEMGADAPRVVLTAHRPYLHCAATDDESLYDHRTVFLGDAERWCYAAADAVLVPCHAIVEALRRPGMDFPLRDGDTHLVRNPFDPKVQAEAPADDLALARRLDLDRTRCTPDEPLLVFGKLQNQKGVWDLIAALSALAGEGRAQPVWMFGRDALHSPSGTSSYDFLEQRYRPLFRQGLVRYFGDYGPGALRDLCAGGAICLAPYREECLPYAVVEMAMAGALPLVGGRGGQVELIPEALRALLVVDFDRPDRLGDAIDAVRALGPEARRRVSDALRAHVAALTDYDAVLAQKLAALDKVTLRSTAPDYPFVHGEARVFGPASAETRAALAAAIPERGAVVRKISAGPPPSALGKADLVSVIVPFHEMQAYVDETLTSIEAQLHRHVELVIVDDGSTSPAAKAKLDAIAAAPRRFPTTLLRKYNGGLADARNAGARAARGDYLYFLDADDTIHPATLSHGLAVLARFRNVAYVGAWLREFGESDRTWMVWDVDSPYIAFHNLQICSFLIRAEAWLRFGVNDVAMSLGMEDYASHVAMFAAGVRGIALPRTYFNYRKRPGSMSQAFDPHVTAFLYRRIAEANPALYARHGALLAGMAAENGHGALAGPPTSDTATHAALFARNVPTLEDVEHELELGASRARLGGALRTRALHGGPAWDYVVARLLLALDQEAGWAERLLTEAVTREPANDWFRLYAILARFRNGRFTAAVALWTDAFDDFCRDEGGAVGWIVALERIRGFPHPAAAMTAVLHRRLGAPARGGDVRFEAIERALERLWAVFKHDAPATRPVREAVKAVLEAAETVISPEAARALADRWLVNWRADGGLDEAAERRLDAAAAVDPTLADLALVAGRGRALSAYWEGPASRYAHSPTGPALAALSQAERTDARLWAEVGTDAAARFDPDPQDSVATPIRLSPTSRLARFRQVVAPR